MQTTRQRIMHYLDAHQQVTAVELSQVLDVTPANIRHHLGVLEKEGQVEVVGQKPAGGRGRPNLIYMPTRQALDHGLEDLAGAFLDELQTHRPEKEQDAQLAQLAQRLSASSPHPGTPMPVRLGAAMQRLNELHYQSHWEAHPDGPQVFLNRCPYARIVDAHPELCRMDQHLLEHLLDTPVEQVEKINRQPGGPLHCRFVLKD